MLLSTKWGGNSVDQTHNFLPGVACSTNCATVPPLLVVVVIEEEKKEVVIVVFNAQYGYVRC